MIRRDCRLNDGSAGWVLISQIEHARISAHLAAQCVGRFSDPNLASVRGEVLAAIASHDDGWADWERCPRIDQGRGRPVSFMELEPAEAIDVWAKSIAAAEEHGPLAAWMVAGHFTRLLEKSEHARHDSAAGAWRAASQEACGEALALWLVKNPALHTRDVAEEALQWLWTFDKASLWFCCNCPVGGETRQEATSRTRVGRGTPLEMELAARLAEAGEAESRGLASALPWRFDAESIDLKAVGRIVRAAPYNSSEAMLAASSPHTLRWQLRRKIL